MPQEKPRYQDLYGSEYTAPEDIPREGLRVQFTKWDIRLLKCAGAKDSWKVVLWAKTADGKPLKKLIAVNKTSAKQLARIWGKPIAGPTADDYAPWLGKTADLSHVKIKAFGELKDAVLISPVVQPVEGQRFEEAYSDENGDVVTAPAPIRRPQAKPQGVQYKGGEPKPLPPKPEPTQQAAVETQLDNSQPEVDPETGEVFTDTLDEPAADELVVVSVEFKDGKRPDGSPYRVYFIKCSDGRTYTSFRDEDGQTAQLRKDAKQGVLITAEAPKTNKSGKEYFPIITLQ